MKHYYSKSKFVLFQGCSKRLWLEHYKKDEKIEVNNETQLINGNLIGDLAMGLFGDFYLAETKDNNLNIQAENTKKALVRNEKVICEAAFLYENHYCAVDILVKDSDGYSVYEVKSTTHVEKHYYYDLAYQYYVLKNIGLKINKLNLVHINSDYVLDGELNLNDYFVINDLTSEVKDKYDEVCSLLEMSDKILDSDIELPSVINSTCNKNGGCPYLAYCRKYNNIPEANSVFDLYNNRSKIKQVNNNILTFNDLLANGVKLSDIQRRQIDFALNNKEVLYIDKQKVKAFLDSFTFPLYFFDFETYQDIIPKYTGCRPYQQIPFQYSLHILYKDGELEHKEFLGDGLNNPIYDIANSMLNDLGIGGSIVAYNDSFEKSRIKELAYIVTDKKNELFALVDRFVDLADVFQNGYCYNKQMGGSFSIKSVLPALFPNDPELNYKNLEGVHKGDEASAAYLALPIMSKEEYDSTRKNLLAYCKLDTYAMVKIYQKLLELIEK